MKKNILLSLLFVAMVLQAQEQNDRPGINEMHTRKWEFIVEKANLTAQDAEKVQPIFTQYEKEVWKLMEKNRAFFMGKKNFADNKKPNFEEMNNRFINTEIEKAQLLKTYYQKLRKVVSDETIFKIGEADRSFRKELIRNWQGNRKQRNLP
ncbi:MAG: hypothetical protein Q7U47_10535 [Paludibacter sp.]|nr:hypothetical protein [Paludibacter sp.]